MATKPLISDYLVPPGHYVREALGELGMSQAELAERMDRPAQAISEIVNGRKEVTEETAFELEAVLGTPAHIWLNLECIYRYGLEARNREAKLKEQEDLVSEFPYKELSELGHVTKTANRLERVDHLLKFFGVAHLELVQNSYAAAYRKAAKRQPAPQCLAAWLRIGEKLAEEVELPPFDKPALRRALPALRRVTRTQGVVDGPIQDVLRPAGVAFVSAQHLPRTYANGAAFWHGRHPVVLLSIRGIYSDIFWFTLFHEVGHILLHGREATFIEGLGLTSKEEKEANEFAANTLIPQAVWDRFVARGDLTRGAVERFAEALGIEPAIVVGRLMHEKHAFDGFHHLRPLRAKMSF